jgi:ubiquinol-cytochrome c reductase cytochrome b subunit
MIKTVLNWLDHRTDLVSFCRALLYERIPGGARWRYAWGSVVLFAFVVQLITGFFLWTNYSPSTQTAYESVYYIQNQMAGGWLLRGIHHYTAQIFVVLVAFHILQMIIDGAYRAPREINFWLALIILQFSVFLSVTGWLLPWDQHGFFGSKIPSNLIQLAPGIGSQLRAVLIGGSEYGTHHTLTRFFAFHVGMLPWLMITAFLIRGYVNRRVGRHYNEAPTHERPDATFWPDQFLRNAVACLAVLLFVLFLVLRPRLFGGKDVGWGVELTAPADPSSNFSAARPEAPFLWLFQMLKSFPGETEVIGAYVIPGIGFTILALMPFIGRWKLGRAFNFAFTMGIVIAISILTTQALLEDSHNAEYQAAAKRGVEQGRRVVQLAEHNGGIPPEGALALLQEDPYTQGPRLFKQHCASCHRHGGEDGLGNGNPNEAPTATDLKGFASREWLTGLLDPTRIATVHYFGGTKFKDGDMVQYVKEDIAGLKGKQKEDLKKVIAALSAEAQLKSQRQSDVTDAATIAEGRKLISADEDFTCIDCHKFAGEGKTKAPDLTGYGSTEWMSAMISNPAHKRFYGEKNDRMPPFGEKRLLDKRQIALIVSWLRGEWYEPGDDAAFVAPGTAVAPKSSPGTAPAATRTAVR